MQQSNISPIYEKKVLSAVTSGARLEGRREVVIVAGRLHESVSPKRRLPASLCRDVESYVWSNEGRDWNPLKAKEGFFAMESYGLNLWDYPWKKELRTISVYLY